MYEGYEHIYIVMEYLKGGELFERIKTKGIYSEADAARIMKRIIKVVGYLHQNHVLHRDIKLENIILTYLLIPHTIVTQIQTWNLK